MNDSIPTQFELYNNTGEEVFPNESLPLKTPLLIYDRLISLDAELLSSNSNDKHLLMDQEFLRSLELGECTYGAASCPVHPFVCNFTGQAGNPRAKDILDSLRVINFRSEHIKTLDAELVPWPGYHPGTENDEIHNDYAHQNLFGIRYQDEGGWGDRVGPIPPDSGTHGKLLQYVSNNKLWYVLLHSWVPTSDDWPRQREVLLFAVGPSEDGCRLVGVISHQLCHNLCD